jgi:hypothetical protein
MKTITATKAQAAAIIDNLNDAIDRQNGWGEYGERITAKTSKDGKLTVRVTMGNCKDAVLNVRNPQRLAVVAIMDALGMDSALVRLDNRDQRPLPFDRTSRGYNYVIDLVD